MPKYNTFLTLFIAAVAAFIIFIVFYIKAVFGIVLHADDFNNLAGHHSSSEILSILFSPGVIISFCAMALCSLAVRVLGIVCVAKNKIVSDGEKALWIVGFVFMGFVTAIIFLIMAKGKKFAE